MKHKKLLFFILILCIFFLVSAKKLIPEKASYPSLILKHPSMLVVKQNSSYQEPGYFSQDQKDGDLTKKVKIKGKVNLFQEGIYKLEYEVTNSSSNTTTAYRYVKVEKENFVYKPSYNNIDNTEKGWWSGNQKDHTIPKGGENAEVLKQYQAYFTGKNEKVIYLTFDEGSNDTYLKEIVDVLNQQNVKATFFLCRRYILENPTLIQNMIKNGHSIGNHTANHKKMPTLANESNFDEYLKEIQRTEEAFYQVTNKKMDKIYREPAGEWSFRSLQIMKDLGYKTYFWSASYMDYGTNVSKEKALQSMIKLYHNGAIYLLHPKNKGNYEALADFIQLMKKQGYHFDLVKNIS